MLTEQVTTFILMNCSIQYFIRLGAKTIPIKKLGKKINGLKNFFCSKTVKKNNQMTNIFDPQISRDLIFLSECSREWK